jgi:pantoate--beta-alanine ligase
VVAKLLLAVRPDAAIFGEKDWQQLAVIRRVEADLGIGVAIMGHATVRENDGLAMSSRNALLSPEDRRNAVALPQTLRGLVRHLSQGRPVAAALADASDRLLVAGFSTVDYLALVDADSLEPLERPCGSMRLIAAASIGGVRLIDNMAVTSEQQLSR